MLEIRTLRTDEYESLHRVLERSFGHSTGWFQRHLPALARHDDEALQWSLVGLSGGQIVAHVGVYPLPLVIGGCPVMAGGIGNVATLPEARGKGYMSRLLHAAIEHMDKQRWPVSVLWGDRRRYGNFGWERAGSSLHLTVPRSYLANTVRAHVRETVQFDAETIAVLKRHYEHMPYRVERPDFSRKLTKAGTRLFTSDAGYAIVRGEQGGNQTVIEVASATGEEPELVAGVLDYTFGSTANVVTEAAPSVRLERLLGMASSWTSQAMGMFRLNDWPALMHTMRPYLEEKVKQAMPFAVAIGMNRGDDVVYVTVTWDGRRLHVEEGRQADLTAVWDEGQLVRVVLGGAAATADALGPAQLLFPIPFFIPQLDYV